jgi:alkanesulfonate monooxygenase SsuD/methylene tetrahydromethanopterin reductase-like flavin-dependent oxidoreductase (luciferase family)
VPFDRPYARVRDTLRFLRGVFRGEYVGGLETLRIDGFALRRPPETPPRLIVGALRPGMLNLAFREADGAITNILSAADVPKVAAAIDSPLAGKEFAVKIFVCPTADSAYARRQGRSFLGWIINQPPYRAFQEWLGRGERLKEVHERWDAADPSGAAAALPDDVVDELWIHGAPERCRELIEHYLHPQVTTAVLYVTPTPEIRNRPGAVLDVLRDLAPAQPVR